MPRTLYPHRPRSGRPLARRGFVALCALATVGAGINFFAQIGAGSLFVDESFSWIVASHRVQALYAAVRLSEVAPPGYYVLLHFWLSLGSSVTQTWMRIPSALAAVGLVAVSGWLGFLLAGRLAAICSAVLLASSPLVLTYAQQARAYAFVMLAATLAVALAVRAMRHERQRLRWIAASAAAAVAAIWLHYTCLPVIIALAAWVLTRSELPRRAKYSYAGALLGAQLLVTPLMIDQASTGNPGADAYAHLTLTNAIDVLGNPLDGRYPSHIIAVIIGASAIAIAAAVVARSPGDRSAQLLIGCAVLPVLALFAVTIVAKPVLITRYCTVATPFALILIAVAAARGRLGQIVALSVAVTAVIGSSSFHAPRSNWPDIGGAYAAAGQHWHASDHIVLTAGIDPILTSAPLVIYYTRRYLPTGTRPIVEPSLSELGGLLRRRGRLWLITTAAASAASVDRVLRPYRYRAASVARFTGNEPVQLTLIVPGGA